MVCCGEPTTTADCNVLPATAAPAHFHFPAVVCLTGRASLQRRRITTTDRCSREYDVMSSCRVVLIGRRLRAWRRPRPLSSRLSSCILRSIIVAGKLLVSSSAAAAAAAELIDRRRRSRIIAMRVVVCVCYIRTINRYVCYAYGMRGDGGGRSRRRC